MTPCRWSGCDQVSWDDALCYFHGKVASGLVDGRDHLITGKNFVREQRALLDGLRSVDAPEGIIAANSLPREPRPPQAMGHTIPSGRLALRFLRGVS